MRTFFGVICILSLVACNEKGGSDGVTHSAGSYGLMKRVESVNGMSIQSVGSVSSNQIGTLDVEPTPAPSPLRANLTGNFEIIVEATINLSSTGDGHQEQAGIILQYANNGGFGWESPKNYWWFILGDNNGAIDNNLPWIGIDKGTQNKDVNGDWVDGGQDVAYQATIDTAGQTDVYLKASRDAINTYFDYSFDGGITWTNAATIGLTAGFDDGEVIIQGNLISDDAIGSPANLSNCQLDGDSLPCFYTPAN